MKTIFKINYFNYVLLLLGGLFLGWLLFHQSGTKDESKQEIHDHNSIWVCSMHPQIRKHEPGKCPICGMNLIPLKENTEIKTDSNAVELSEDALQLANVLTSKVTKQKPVTEIRLYGKVQASEQLVQTQTAHVSGRIERLFVNTTGQSLSRGQSLALVYSPELINAQQELIEAAKNKDSQVEVYQAAKDKLRQWKLSETQINAIEKTGKIKNNISITADVSGFVTTKRVNVGDYINEGSPLFDVTNLSRVWVVFDAYESDLFYLRRGDQLSFSLQAIPGKIFSAKISFIDPMIDPTTRTVKVRVEIGNIEGKLKPEMFATALVHNKIVQTGDALVIPASAVLWTGKRSIVYVREPKVKKPSFVLREVELGAKVGNGYIVLGGLAEGEDVVTQGSFNVDAAAQLAGKPSMMNER